ncbi:MAG: alpha/beta hydrolase, partial [Leadbetterella sp.]|nr:alpha/beta hydrolase [Leadbetterella sp.]
MDIVWIHGFGEDSAVWEDFLPAIHSYHTSHVFDHAARTGLTSIREYAGDLQVFLSEKRIEKAVLIGHSMGGYIALEYAAQYPEQVQGLGLFHSSAAADSETKKKERDKTRSFIEEKGTTPFIRNFY